MSQVMVVNGAQLSLNFVICNRWSEGFIQRRGISRTATPKKWSTPFPSVHARRIPHGCPRAVDDSLMKLSAAIKYMPPPHLQRLFHLANSLALPNLFTSQDYRVLVPISQSTPINSGSPFSYSEAMPTILPSQCNSWFRVPFFLCIRLPNLRSRNRRVQRRLCVYRGEETTAEERGAKGLGRRARLQAALHAQFCATRKKYTRKHCARRPRRNTSR